MNALPRLRTLCAALMLTLPLAHNAFAQVTVTDPWVRGTVPEQKATGAFMRLTAPVDSRVVEARSPAAGTVEIHEMKMDNGVMRMRAVPALPLPANKAVDLVPGGYHVMLMGLKQPLKAGDSVPITLVVEGPTSSGARSKSMLRCVLSIRRLRRPATARTSTDRYSASTDPQRGHSATVCTSA